MKFMLTLMLLPLLTSNVKAQETVFLRFRDSDPKIDSYSYNQMMKALMLDKYKQDFKSCAKNLEKYYRLEPHQVIINNPSQDAFYSYLSSLNSTFNTGLKVYALELNPGVVDYNDAHYNSARKLYEKYKKMGINLRDESANTFVLTFDMYRELRLKGHSSGYIVEQMDESALNGIAKSLKAKWGSKLGPQTNYQEVIEAFYEVQLMIYMEKKLAATFPSVFNEAKSTVPSCKESFLKALKEVAEKETEYANWNGTFVDSYGSVTISSGGSSMSASFNSKGPEDNWENIGQWSDCEVTGNTVKCNWTCSYSDNDKAGTRKGTIEVTLNGNTISGSYYEDTPTFTWKPGITNKYTKMGKGAVWPFNMKRK